MVTTRAPQKPAPQDWHPADIIAALWKRRMSLRRLSRLSGFAGDSLKMAVRRPWPKAEKIIADFLGVAPQAIWPSRYNADDTPKSGLHSRSAVAHRAQHDNARRAA